MAWEMLKRFSAFAEPCVFDARSGADPGVCSAERNAFMETLLWFESLGISIWIRETPGLLAYPLILALHGVGLAWLVGLNAAVDVRLLGYAPGLTLDQLAKFYPLMVGAFWLNAITGLILTFAFASTMLTNPALYVKLACILLAVVILRMIKTRFLDDPASLDRNAGGARVLAVVSIVAWVGAIVAGRLMAYIHLIFDMA
jgi:hypothetical protein